MTASRRKLAALSLVCGIVAVPALAEVLSYSGAATATAEKLINGVSAGIEETTRAFPADTATLPAQVVARQLTDVSEAAASVAAQFADPFTSQELNPEEFAINLALLSISDEISYRGNAVVTESRRIQFTQSDFPTQAAGEDFNLTGRLFLDGALAIFSPFPDRDLTGAGVTMTVTVVRQVEGEDDETVFSGAVGLQGGTGSSVTTVAEGQFPTLTLIRTNLAAFVADFETYELLIVPRVEVDYTYRVRFGRPVTLVATIEVEAANAEDNVGVAALIGTPVDSIQEVIAAAQGKETANKAVAAMLSERENPTGSPAFPSAALSLSACGLLGFSPLLIMLGLLAMKIRIVPLSISRRSPRTP